MPSEQTKGALYGQAQCIHQQGLRMLWNSEPLMLFSTLTARATLLNSTCTNSKAQASTDYVSVQPGGQFTVMWSRPARQMPRIVPLTCMACTAGLGSCFGLCHVSRTQMLRPAIDCPGFLSLGPFKDLSTKRCHQKTVHCGVRNLQGTCLEWRLGLYLAILAYITLPHALLHASSTCSV